VIRRSLLFVVAAGVFASSIGINAQAPAAPAQPAAAEEVKPNDYKDEKTWLCRPGRKGDACDIDLTTTVVAADGTMTKETWTADPKAPIDCFYVYPTVSTDPGLTSDMTADPAETNVVMQQFARFGSKCRTFAPIYRQITLAGLMRRLSGGGRSVPFESGVQFTDVRDAWQSYLKNDNQGRGFVLIGHSQGAYILQELITQEIDGKPIQKQLVGAYILGATFLTPKGKDVGGRFQQIPLCRKPGQFGCVVNFSSFRSTVPPPANTLFGHSDDPAMSGSCTNPVTLGEGGAPLRAYLSTSGRTITGTVATKPWVADKTVDTPFVSVPGLLTAQCKTNEFSTYLEVTVNGNPADPRIDDITGDIGAVGKPLANWGLHLIDVNLAMGNLLDLVDAQSKAYRARK
jgi:hypothetical protein